MRIDASVQMAATPVIQQEQGAASFPRQGDVIRAQVLSEGDGVVSLRTEDGRMFIAKLAAEAMLVPNDQAELLVVESALDRLVLRLIYVETGVPKLPELPVEKATVSQQQVLTPEMAELLQAFDNMEGKPSSSTLKAAEQMMREQGIDAKTAAFFVANEMDFSEENIRALNGFTKADTGKTLYKLAQVVRSDSGKVLTPDTKVNNSSRADRPISLQPNEQKPVLQGKNPAVHGDQPAHHRTAVIGDTQVKLSQDTTKASKDAAARTVHSNDVTVQNTDTPSAGNMETVKPDAQKGISQTTTQPDISTKSSMVIAPKQSTVPVEHAADTPAAVDHEGANSSRVSGEQENSGQSETFDIQRTAAQKNQSMPEKMLSLFAQAEEGLDAQSLKKSADGMRNQLPELQEMLRHTDIHDKSVVLAQLDDVNAQAKLAQDISRYLCMQIPVHMKGYETAELYVYRRNRKNGKIDPENTSIVLGISTQNLGRVEAVIRVENRAISIAFSIENEAAIPTFQQEAVQLKKSLSGMHFSLAECRVSGLKERTTPLNAEGVLSFSVKQRRGVTFEYMV